MARWVHVARKAPENPIFKAERPWEGNRILYSNVIYDPKERLYKLWYNVRPESTNYLCFATSGDGIRFRRPDLGLREFQGSRKNNLLVIPEDITEIRVFYDDHDPERPYKMAFMKYDTYGIGVGWSSDGLQRGTSHPYPVIVPAGDGLSTPFWDQRRERYVYYHRPNGGHVLRWSNDPDSGSLPHTANRSGGEFQFHPLDGPQRRSLCLTSGTVPAPSSTTCPSFPMRAGTWAC